MNKVFVFIVVALTLGLNMTQNVTNLSGNEIPMVNEIPVGDGNTTVSNEWIIMKAYYYPGGAMTEEEFENGKDVYTITSEGEVTNKDGEIIWLKGTDLDDIARLHTKFIKGKVKEHKRLICDYPSFVVTAYENGKEEEYTSDANQQCDEVEKVFEIISSYYSED